jgi:hypothetical protein
MNPVIPATLKNLRRLIKRGYKPTKHLIMAECDYLVLKGKTIYGLEADEIC